MSKRSTYFIMLAFCLFASLVIASDKSQVAGLTYDARGITQKPANSPADYSEPGGSIILSGDCSDYIDISDEPLPILEAGSTIGATNDYGPYPQRPDCWQGQWFTAGGAGPDVTYKWTAPADSFYVISLLHSSYDTGLELYNFTCPSEPTYPDDFICGNDDWGGYAQSRLLLHLSEGQEILVVADGYGNSSGYYQLDIYFGQDPQDFEVDCPENTLYGQPPSGPLGQYYLCTSDLYQGVIVYDNLPAEDMEICGIQFHGFDNYYSGGRWWECTEDPGDFLVSFYEDGEYPGDLIWERVITPVRVQLEYNYSGFVLNEYRGGFDTCLTVNGGWISVQGASNGGDPGDCTFIWLSSRDGDDHCWQYGSGIWQDRGASLSFCLLDSTATATYGDAPDVQRTIALSQNYPNPFNAQTTIEFSIPRASHVRISIFDLVGREVATIANGEFDAGVNRVIWNAGEMMSGIYFYRIKAGEFVESKRMLLLK